MSEKVDLNIWTDDTIPAVGAAELNVSERRLVRKIRQAPKVELHIHVEGTIGFKADDTRSRRSSWGRVAYENFFAHWFRVIDTLRTEPQFLDAARNFKRGLRRAGVVWCEAFVSPPDLVMRKNSPLPFAIALRRWLEAFYQVRNDEPPVRFIVDLVRLYSSKRASLWLDEVLLARDTIPGEHIIGIGLGGPQDAYPLREFIEVARRGKEAGLLVVAHAGERGSGDDVYEAIFDLHVDRIGHGIGLVKSPDSYRQLLLNRIPIEACPTSNVTLGCVSTFEEHPIRRWLQDGAIVSAFTDDPAILRSELCLEYLHLHRAFGWCEPEFKVLLNNAVNASTMHCVAKQQILSRQESVLEPRTEN